MQHGLQLVYVVESVPVDIVNDWGIGMLICCGSFFLVIFSTSCVRSYLQVVTVAMIFFVCLGNSSGTFSVSSAFYYLGSLNGNVGHDKWNSIWHVVTPERVRSFI